MKCLANPIPGIRGNLNLEGTWNFAARHAGTFEGGGFVTVTPNSALRWGWDEGGAKAFIEVGVNGSVKWAVDDLLRGALPDAKCGGR